MSAIRIPYPVFVWTTLALVTAAAFIAMAHALQEGKFLF